MSSIGWREMGVGLGVLLMAVFGACGPEQTPDVAAIAPAAVGGAHEDDPEQAEWEAADGAAAETWGATQESAEQAWDSTEERAEEAVDAITE